jgi:ribulose-bisphosphate carboxylase large chain
MADVIATDFFIPETGISPEEAARGIVEEETTGTCGGLRRVFPVSSGGLQPGNVHRELEVLGNDLILQAGGGIHGNPDGTEAGARAMRQAVDTWMEGLTLEEYAQDHVELERALAKWGVVHG